MRNPDTSMISKRQPAPARIPRDRLAEVVCLALALAVLTLTGRIVALW